MAGGRQRRQRKLTQDQIDWRNSILRKRVDSVNKADKKPSPEPLSHDDEIKKCFYYLNNCVFWVNEYIDGRVDKNRLLETAVAIQITGKNIENLLNPNPNAH